MVKLQDGVMRSNIDVSFFAARIPLHSFFHLQRVVSMWITYFPAGNTIKIQFLLPSSQKTAFLLPS
ncbi:MAG: hypothetical protein Greene071421_67 [Parcubacteria group bacterium Greene0714_21]|nr:MAG: hypothetical protein Greene041639_465 [Parcubacteria group bacterium Greene0416_39]TSC97825.1 MAG: hypothetical protein Greene101447_276 [Parcubacteria group bacterium Greene1014_47]TSD04581.1 MAG: hypothetical protein Greene071421_67 [Parcubacteria group bacterium Greene0714_21]